MADGTQYEFVNYGGSMQLRIDGAEDLRALPGLDEPFWMATSAPIHQLRAEPLLLSRLDGGGNGRILSTDLRNACSWLFRVLKDTSGIERRSAELSLAAINTEDPEGARLHGAARAVLHNLGQTEADTLSIGEVRDRKTILARGRHNGDGVIPLNALIDPALRTLVSDIMETVGEIPDINGSPGVDSELLEQFVTEAKRLKAWQALADAVDGPAMFPLGDDTHRAHQQLKALAPRIDAYFNLCRLTELGAVARARVPAPLTDPAILRDSSRLMAFLEDIPLARPRPEPMLLLDEHVNPFLKEDLDALCAQVIAPLLGERWKGDALSEAQWLEVKAAFQAFDAWQAERGDSRLEKLGPARIDAHLTSDVVRRLRTLIAADLAAEPELASLQDLEYLILLQSSIMDLCNNFVSFPHLFEPDRRAMFEMGRLIIDGKIFNFNVKVKDINSHAATAERSGIFLMYSEVTAELAKDTFYMVTPVTAGRVGTLGVGKRGVLFDLDNREWDVRVVKIVDNPVSLIRAVLTPVRRLMDRVSETTKKALVDAEKEVTAGLTSAADGVRDGVRGGVKVAIDDANVPQAPAPPATAQPAQPVGAPHGLKEAMLTGSVAFAAVGSAFAFITKTLSELQWERVVAAAAVGVAVIIVPVILTSIYRLKRRNLSAILEASGWAFNAPMFLTLALGKVLSYKPERPRAFKHNRTDRLKRLTAESKKARQKAR